MCHKGHHYPGRAFIETLILWIIHKQPLHGYGVKKKIEEITTGSYTPKSGAIYTILRRMEKKGLLTSQWNERTGKKDRRVYRITDQGEILLKTRLKIMKERIGLLERMISYYNSYFAEDRP